MGRKSKPPITFKISSEVRTEVIPNDGLPAFANYIDVPFERKHRQSLSRLFLSIPMQEDIDDTVIFRNQIDKDSITVLGARMPYMNDGVRVSPCLYEYCLEKGFSKDFSVSLVRLVINYFQGKHFAADTLGDKIRSLRMFVDFIFSQTKIPLQFTINDIGRNIWLDYLKHVETSCVKADQVFNDVRAFFYAYEPTTLSGWLGQVSVASRKLKPNTEHTSELVDASYSDAIMYQILALCLEGFQRRISYLIRYESLTEADMPSDWLYPGRDNRKIAEGNRKLGPIKGAKFDTESRNLLKKWLLDEEVGYPILIDHFILHHKAGLIKRNANKLGGGIVGSLNGLGHHKELRPLLDRFWKTTALWHGFNYPMPSRTIWQYYLKKKTANEINKVINQIAWCLANILMMQTGINKEVAMSIPSKAEDGRSILLREDSLFVSGDSSGTEVEIYGFKERGGQKRRKIIPISIAKNSPLYKMLVDYECYVKVDSTGPFFEVNKEFNHNWNRAGGLFEFTMVYPIVDDNGKQLSSIDTTIFRKVFASGQLLDRIQGVKNGNDLAEKLRTDLHHGTLDMTLTHYLLKTNIGRSVIDTAIATITSEKLAEALHFKGRIILTKDVSVKKKVFLCDCEDPTNPSHDVAIADECKHYDLCLGCERSIITKFHLPYICARILQYEEERLADPHIWTATFEDLWCVAHDALDQYVKMDMQNGQRFVDEAWISAKEGSISLPPIINTNRM